MILPQAKSLKEIAHWRIAGHVLLSLIAVTLIIANSELWARLSLPLYNAVIPYLYSSFDQVVVTLQTLKSETFFVLQANNSSPIVYNAQSLPANLQPSSRTLIAHSLQHPLFILPAVLLGSLFYPCNGMRLLITTFVALLIMACIDVPMLLTGSIEDLMRTHFGNDGMLSALRIQWMQLLNNGGRIGLSLALAGIALLLSAQVATSSDEFTVIAKNKKFT